MLSIYRCGEHCHYPPQESPQLLFELRRKTCTGSAGPMVQHANNDGEVNEEEHRSQFDNSSSHKKQNHFHCHLSY